MSFIKKQSYGFYLYALAVLSAIIAFIIYLANANGTYYSDPQPAVIICTIFAILLMIAVPVAAQFMGNKRYLDILPLLAVILLAVCVMASFGSRIESMGWILWSDLESGNENAVGALSQFFVSWSFYIASLVLCIAAGFFCTVKEDVRNNRQIA